MKKTLFASTLALTLGFTGVATHATDANAAEENIDKAELAELASSNDPSLNQHPIHEGAYDYTFTLDGVSYHFWSNGTQFGWSYNGYGNVTDTVAQPSQFDIQDVNTQATQSNGSNTVSNVQQSNTQAPAATSAPQTTQTSTASTGVNAHLALIKDRESGGNYSAINPTSGAAGAYQFLQPTWDSVARSIDPSYVGKNPASAPASVQDRFAQYLYNTAGPSQWVTA
ncbi:transglycosylase [Staphylococcus felis]|uniref:transglycosylase family protein n=1 Tax=Staphylococcus felis TaxID=46127 RepID=UPI000E248A1C|nr:transglycosylase family protein [Staphylococcus felis]REI00940.1 transglycosylase [Staphylococcus felis]REI24531.1 transglycosylase [Staphylococcus felis]